MGKYATLIMAKRHLNIEDAFTDDDTYIESLITVAEEKVAAELCVSVEEMAAINKNGSLPMPLLQAILLTIGAYYTNREDITTVQTKPLEYGVKYLTQLYRNFTL
jgi:hypothetical protein